MKSAWARMLCRLLMVLMVWSPMQFAQAGMIGTDQVASAASQADRNTVTEFLGRANVTGQLQALGVDPATVKDRVAAMSDQEVQSLAGKIVYFPAVQGGVAAGWAFLTLVGRGVAPAGVIFGRTNPVMIQGLVLAGIATMHRCEPDPFTVLKTGDRIRMSPARGTVERLG